VAALAENPAVACKDLVAGRQGLVAVWQGAAVIAETLAVERMVLEIVGWENQVVGVAIARFGYSPS
jgi:hypothetical protein